ncbi:MAG: PH domain-containing protein [Candidatus Paceibacterota bacterium]|jgi:hypothetical protein|nr:PH domain-containing protein [Candidatus Paceibacterota bacterium]
MIDLEQNEKILLHARRHWFFLFQKILSLIPLVVIPVIVIFSVPMTVDSFSFSEKSGVALIIFFLFSWLLCIWITSFIMWTDFYLDVLIVTDHRVINVEQKALFSRETSSLHLDKIQDVSVDVHGVIATFLSFGTLRIQTAGETGEFGIKGIKEPDQVKKIILEQHEKAMAKLRTVRIES